MTVVGICLLIQIHQPIFQIKIQLDFYAFSLLRSRIKSKQTNTRPCGYIFCRCCVQRKRVESFNSNDVCASLTNLKSDIFH